MTSISHDELLERVRARYAAAADAVTTGQAGGCGTDASAASACCAPTKSAASGTAESVSCCGPAAEAQAELDVSFGAGLYDAEE